MSRTSEEKKPNNILQVENFIYPILGSAPSADNLFRRSSRSPPATSQSIARLIEKGDEVGGVVGGGGGGGGGAIGREGEHIAHISLGGAV